MFFFAGESYTFLSSVGFRIHSTTSQVSFRLSSIFQNHHWWSLCNLNIEYIKIFLRRMVGLDIFSGWSVSSAVANSCLTSLVFHTDAHTCTHILYMHKGRIIQLVIRNAWQEYTDTDSRTQCIICSNRLWS